MNKFLILILILVSISCDDAERRRTLDQREAMLNEKERQLGAREAEFQSLIKMRDSLNMLREKPKPATWPNFVSGNWTSKIVCTESNCSDYVIGDVRSDNWEFVRDSARMYVNIRDRRKLVRVYGANFTDGHIQLDFTSDSTAAKKVEMKVTLNEIAPDRLRGIRTVTIGDGCKATFNVTLTRPAAAQ